MTDPQQNKTTVADRNVIDNQIVYATVVFVRLGNTQMLEIELNT